MAQEHAPGALLLIGPDGQVTVMPFNLNGSIFRKYGFPSIFVWTVVILVLAAIAVTNDHKDIQRKAEEEAREYFHLNLHYRAWAAKMGGVYVPSAKAQPNPYLKVPNRDIKSSDGQDLTLVNPAYMTRMVFDSIRESSSPVFSRIVSLKPLNPVNAPDPWERRSLLAFERGERRERSEVVSIGGSPYLRFISAFITEPSCLKCHAVQGYRAGEVRGALVVSVPLARKLAEQQGKDRSTAGRYLVLWMLGTAWIGVSARRRYEDTAQLCASEQKFRTVCDWTQDWEYWLSPDGEIKYMSPSCRDITGYTREEFLDEPELLVRVAHPDFREQLRKLHAKGDATPGQPAEMLEMQITTREGESRWIQLLSRPIFEEQVYLGRRASNRDITRQKQDTDKIRLNESRLVTLLGILQFPAETVQGFLDNAIEEATRLTGSGLGYISYYDEAGRRFTLSSWSGGVMRECGLDNAQMACSLDDAGLWAEAVRRRRAVVVNDCASPSPLKHGAPPGHVRLQRLMTIPVFSGERIVAVVGVANKAANYDDTDVLQLTLLMESVWKTVENKWAAQDLEESNERFSAAFNSAPLMMSVSSLEDGTYLEVNQRFLDAAEWSREEVIGRRSVDLGWITDTQRAVLTQKMLRDGRIQGHEVTLHARSGRPVLCKVWMEMISVAGVKRLLTIALDITEHRQVEQHFLQAQKMESIGQLAGGVAHDFNNMLSVILGHAEMGLLEDEVAPSQRKHLEAILDAANRSAAITKQLLTFARRQNVLPRVIDLNEAVAGMLKMLARLIGEDIDLVWAPGQGVDRVKVDPSQVDQLMANLCVNARDAINGVGRITIRTENVTLAGALLDAASGVPPGRYVRLSVSDTGQGMAQEVLQHVFEPFYTTKGQGKGTGLGLATVFGIVKQNQGEIRVESEPGCGATFSIYLPAIAAEEGGDLRGEQGLFRGGSETVLVVEDEVWVREMVSEMLGSLGYRVVVAATAEEAVSIARALDRPPQLLLTDVIMPKLNGRDLARQLSALYPDLKTLFMSGYTSDFIARHGVIDETVHFLPKPFTLPTLAAKVREVLDQK